VNARNLDDEQVEIAYVAKGEAKAVRAKHCILAGYGGIVPHLCPELPEAQKEHLAYGVKAPFICTNVLLRNSEAVRKTGVSGYQCPGSFYSLLASAPPVNVGDFRGDVDAALANSASYQCNVCARCLSVGSPQVAIDVLRRD
jgi:spermidine dehydrogenase